MGVASSDDTPFAAMVAPAKGIRIIGVSNSFVIMAICYMSE